MERTIKSLCRTLVVIVIRYKFNRMNIKHTLIYTAFHIFSCDFFIVQYKYFIWY